MTQATRAHLDRFWNDPSNWTALGVYRCAADPRLVVPKQQPMAGWTVNFARGGAKPLLVSIVGLAVVPTLLAVLFAVQDPWAWLAIVAGSGAAVLVTTFGLDRQARGKTFFPRPGKLPQDMRPILEQEGIELIAEGVRGSVRFKNFRAPGKRYPGRINGFTGSLVLTGRRFAAFTSLRSIVDLPFDDARFGQLFCSLRGEQTLSVRFDPALFNRQHSGSIEIRINTPLASSFLGRLKARGCS